MEIPDIPDRFLPGDKSQAICGDCGGLQPTTMAVRKVPFSDGSAEPVTLLACVCDGCDQVVAIPAQSTKDIVRSRLRAKLAGAEAGKMVSVTSMTREERREFLTRA